MLNNAAHTVGKIHGHFLDQRAFFLVDALDGCDNVLSLCAFDHGDERPLLAPAVLVSNDGVKLSA